MFLNKLRKPIKIRFYTTNSNDKELVDLNIKLLIDQNAKLLKELEVAKHQILLNKVSKNECIEIKQPSNLLANVSSGIFAALYIILLMGMVSAMCYFIDNNNKVMTFICFVLLIIMVVPLAA
jgi:hypothetical protein